jgi:DNA (cytosine-5)-methyltransferase 1
MWTVADLFCGAGGLSLGFQQAGFDLRFAVDHHADAVATYRRNLGEPVLHDEIDRSCLERIPAADVIVGGPPCQGFSSAGARRNQDERNSLVRVFAETIALRKPRLFVFENVEGFLTTDEGQYIIDLLDPVLEAGYHIHIRKVNAANYGVPQHRKRVLVIGGLGFAPTFPAPTHRAYGAPGSDQIGYGLPLTPTLADAVATLPKAVMDGVGELLTGHSYKPLNKIDLARAEQLQPGQTMKDLPHHLQHPSYQRRALRRVMDGTPSERRGGAPAGLRRLRWDEPSKTITGGALNEFLHPLEHRSLTLRECARLQTFPDSFVFSGSSAVQMQLIGNAVPPHLAYQIACSVAADLAAHVTEQGPGQLLSFVPSVSTGLSPVLGRVMHRLRSRYGIEAEAAFQLGLPWG